MRLYALFVFPNHCQAAGNGRNKKNTIMNLSELFPSKSHVSAFKATTGKLVLMTALLITAGSCGDSETTDGGEKPVISDNSNANDNSLQPELARLEFPKVKKENSFVIIHKTNDTYGPDGINISIEWDYSKKSQRWTCYQMYNGFGGNAGRWGSFEEDPDVPSYARFSDTSAMYRGSGYTRGHICPSADRQYSKDANHQTFYYTNMQPQYYNFNAGDNYQGIWVRLEDAVRSWARQSSKDASGRMVPDTLYVVKGGTIDNENQIIERVKGELIVPKYFFVAILCKNASGYKMIGFWTEHTQDGSASASIYDKIVSVNELERLTGIDFFCNLPDKDENRLQNLSHDQMARAWGINEN